MKRIVNILVTILIVATLLLGFFSSTSDAARGGRKGPPEAGEGSKGKSPAAPDQDGRGRDRGSHEPPPGDKPPNGGDGDNGSGNDPDCEDDNNGVGVPARCRPTAVPTTAPTTVPTTVPTVVPTPTPTEKGPETCELVLLGETPELFPLNWRPEHGEEGLLAEAHGELRYTLLHGGGATYFFWTPELGHTARAQFGNVVCTSSDIVVREWPWEVVNLLANLGQ